MDDTVGQQPRALALELLLLVGSDPKLTRIGVRHGTYQFMVGLAAIQCSLHIAAKAQGIDGVQQITALITAVQLPHGFLCAVLARVRAELVDNHTLGCDLRGEGGEDLHDIVLLGENQPCVYLAARLQQKVWVVIARVLEVGEWPAGNQVLACGGPALRWPPYVLQPH